MAMALMVVGGCRWLRCCFLLALAYLFPIPTQSTKRICECGGCSYVFNVPHSTESPNAPSAKPDQPNDPPMLGMKRCRWSDAVGG